MFMPDLSSYVCTGSLVSNDIVVTAAHCILDVTPEMGISVQYGVIDWTLATPNQKQDFLFDYGAHPDFHGFVIYPVSSDIGYVRLDTPIDPADWDGTVDIIPIADAEAEVGDLVTMIGWGGTEAFGPVSYTLNYGQNYVVSDTEAFEIFGADSFVPAEFFCVDSRSFTGHSGTCGGDSGGPITSDAVYENALLWGATSFGLGNCELGVSCFTNVPYFRQWLTDNTGEDFGP